MNTINQNSLTPWIKIIPTHWQAHRLGFVANVIFSNVDKHTIEGEIPVRLCNYTNVYNNTRITSSTEFMLASAQPRELVKFQVKKGDVLATKDSESPNDIAVSALISEELPEVLCGYHLAIVRPDKRKLCGTFLSWVQASKEILAQYEARATGVTRFALGQSAFKEAYVPLPPLLEQHRIVAYLDKQTAKIDRLMEMRRQQMDLLKEQRAALIQQAVTRGLNPNAPMKESGLPWLGEIPGHWKTASLGRLATLLQTGPFGSQLHAHEYVEGGIPIINPSHMAEGSIQPDQKCTVDETTAKRLGRHFLHAGDIVFARRGELGRCALVRTEEVNWLCGTGSLLMRPDIRVIEPAFLVTLFQLIRLKESLTLQSVGSTMDNLNTGILSRTGLPLPPLYEQTEILNFIEEQRAKFDALHEAYARQLTLLAEYRAALIHECVTGQRENFEPAPALTPALPESPLRSAYLRGGRGKMGGRAHAL